MNRLLAVPLLLLAIALAVIGTLQYRWLDQVAEAERQQMRRTLEFASERLEGEITTQLHTVFRAFIGAEDQDVRWMLEDWESEPLEHDLVAAIYVAERDGSEWTVHLLDRETRELTDAPLPPALVPLHRALYNLGERGPDERFPGPMFGPEPALLVVQGPPSGGEGFSRGQPPRRAILLLLDRAALGAVIADHVRAIAGDLDVELMSRGMPLYRSSGTMKQPPDLRRAFRPVVPRQRPGPPRDEQGRDPRREPPSRDVWELGMSHRGGGLDAIVAAAHRRNLAVAALVLLLLVASSALLIALLRRGEKLRAQQSQFVAAMSHELNTPLAILRVASENLQDGIVQDPEKTQRYVRTIARETAHLSEMVNHVLELAGMNAGVTVAAREPVDIERTIQEAVAQSRWMIQGSEIALDVDLAPDLPQVLGDERALTRAVQNLVANAIRHAGGGKWVGVRAARDDGFVRITVEDRGPGIEAGDEGHVFEPFYRGRNSRNVRGTGLGLTIVNQIVAQHGGSIAVERGRPAGAAFVVRLPAEGVS